MFDASQLPTFVVVATVLVAMPGPNTVLILSHGVTGGRRAGIAATLGVETGTLVHSLAAGIGMSAFLVTSPAAFAAVKYAGAACLGYLGVGLWLGGTAPAVRLDPAERGRALRIFLRALWVSLLNPKAAVFFAALLPQFVDHSRGHVVAQFVALGAIVALIGLTLNVSLTMAVTRDTVRLWLGSDRARRWQARVTGAALVGLGVRLALT